MKIVNIKFNFKAFIILILIIIITLTSIFFINLFDTTTIVMTNENYTKILKDVHDNIDSYLGKKIISTGYVFRANDFAENRFVVARDMIVSENDYRIVGFLCEYDKIKNFENNIWVEIKGFISSKDYHGPMPVIEISEINKITTPNETHVYPPAK